MGHRDVRDWIKIIEEDGELKKINGADWNLEMGGITEGITEILFLSGRVVNSYHK